MRSLRVTVFGLLFSAALLTTAHGFGSEGMSMSLSGYLEGRAIAPFDRDTPEEYPTGELGLELNGDLASWCSLKVFLQGVDDGKVMAPGNGLLFNEFNKVYQDKNPYIDIDEAYIDFYTGNLDFRFGIQKFAWGRLDEINPTDNLNTEDLTEGGTNDEIDRKIGVPAVKGNLYTNLVNVELAWIPRYVPYRLPTPEERWFPGVLKPPKVVETGTAVGGIPTNTTYRDIDLPPFTFENSEGGIRFMKYVGGWDLSVSYYTGFDMMPLMGTDVDLVVTLEDLLALDYSIRADLEMEPRIDRIHVYGFDFTTTVSSFTIRGEFAYFYNKHYNRKLESVLRQEVTEQRQEEIFTEFLDEYLDSGGTANSQTFRIDPQIALQMDSMKYGLGIDYIYGDTSVSAQCIQEFIPDYDKDMPVYFNKNGLDTLLSFSFKQFFLQNTMEINLDCAYNIEFQGHVMKPSLKYNFTENLIGRIGILFIDGKYDDSLFGQYRNNDQVYASLRCNF